MSNSKADGRGSSGRGRIAVASLYGIARSWQVGTVLVLLAVIFVALSWRSVDFKGLFDLPVGNLVVAGLAYAGSIVAMAAVALPGSDQDRRALLGSGLSTQLLKYVPGTIWQGQRMLAVGGMGVVARFAGAVLVSAGLGLLFSGQLIVTLFGLGIVTVLTVIGVRTLGLRAGARVFVLSTMIALGIFASGALLGSGLGLKSIVAGRDVLAAWGLGVLAVPVPAGIGIREFYFSLVADSDAGAQLAVVHRALTLAVDVITGVIGIRMSWRR